MRAAGAAAVGAATRRRLAHAAAAHEDQIRRLRELLAPLGVGDSAIAQATHQGLGTRLPLEQGLTNYYVNLHRDWAWGEEENAAGLAEIVQALGGGARGLGRTLVHGAGAGRLAYDLHAAGDAPLTVATDFNPLLLLVAREMFGSVASSGRSGRMRDTASRTSSMACDRSVSNWNSMKVCELPVETVELMFSMPTMFETASSILRVISVSICEGGTPA